MRNPHNLKSTQQRERQEELQPFRKHYHDSDSRGRLEHQLISLRLTLWPRITPPEPPATCLAIALLF